MSNETECVEHEYDEDGYCENCFNLKPCDHRYNHYGYCSLCGEARVCVLCKNEPFTGACDFCEDGRRLCDNCYTRCNDCSQRCCVICDQNGQHECAGKDGASPYKKPRRDPQDLKTDAQEEYLGNVLKANGFVFAKISPIDVYLTKDHPFLSCELQQEHSNVSRTIQPGKIKAES